ncbi:integrase catalytic domain-containing protein [Trichonephila clavata]|uniref:Integrase catalytic domain-containing protein n=1 Tax=Trichonephila clavata TaxID=2740835 RepID=A0A8X6G3P8_TRICU|nr:integrase catalytic domain-containing protein [Trichonephila clavata]
MSDVYMDDLLTGANDLKSGRKLQEQLVSLLKGAGMELHKWSSSNTLLLPDSMCQDKDLSYSSSTETKTLGLLWKPHPDSFAFKISPMTSSCDSLIVTKKSVISTIARIFDPLGLIGPVITRAKILLQSLWQLKLDWNDPLPSNLVSYWKSFIDALESINCLNIPRYCLQDKSIRTELHGFSDSFEKAYGAALYLHGINSSGQISDRLLCSKSKVAPLKKKGIPLPNSCKLLNLHPFLDDSGLFRVGGRLRNSPIPRNQKHPMVILTNLNFTYIVINHFQILYFHTCAEATLANIRNSFWIPSARNVVRKILRAHASPVERLSQWQLVQRMNQHFWRKWSSEYLNRLQQRPKWCKGNVGFKEGDLVLVKPSENLDTLKWHLARIIKLHPGKDNLVRVVTLKDNQGVYKGPVTKIANLPYVN